MNNLVDDLLCELSMVMTMRKFAAWQIRVFRMHTGKSKLSMFVCN